MHMKRSFLDITRDMVLAKADYEIFNEEDLMKRVNELFQELRQKEDGVYWLYQESEKEVQMFETQIKKYQAHVAMMKKAQERLKQLVVNSYEQVKELPAHTDFNPIKIAQSGGKVDIIEEDNIPEEYFIEVISKKLDKKRILEELKGGADIPGVRLVKKSFVRGLK